MNNGVWLLLIWCFQNFAFAFAFSDSSIWSLDFFLFFLTLNSSSLWTKCLFFFLSCIYPGGKFTKGMYSSSSFSCFSCSWIPSSSADHKSHLFTWNVLPGLITYFFLRILTFLTMIWQKSMYISASHTTKLSYWSVCCTDARKAN